VKLREQGVRLRIDHRSQRIDDVSVAHLDLPIVEVDQAPKTSGVFLQREIDKMAVTTLRGAPWEIRARASSLRSRLYEGYHR
jgi:hypothetical protein